MSQNRSHPGRPIGRRDQTSSPQPPVDWKQAEYLASYLTYVFRYFVLQSVCHNEGRPLRIPKHIRRFVPVCGSTRRSFAFLYSIVQAADGLRAWGPGKNGLEDRAWAPSVRRLACGWGCGARLTGEPDAGAFHGAPLRMKCGWGFWRPAYWDRYARAHTIRAKRTAACDCVGRTSSALCPPCWNARSDRQPPGTGAARGGIRKRSAEAKQAGAPPPTIL
jgi:hypothetical protein